MLPHKILVIDDNAFILKLVHDILDRYGYVVFTARTGLGGYEVACNEHPDLIILDLRLEDIGGLKVLDKIKDNNAIKAIPVAMLSSENNYHEILKSLAFGAEDYIVKPFKQSTLTKKVLRLLHRQPRAKHEFVYV
ncbi:MAG: response regulator [Rhodospirillales bacterium]|nr:response regulator [Alphaproteobacteria bacterium]MCB9981738.1 response regulator [Rhodospirillales bacterium]